MDKLPTIVSAVIIILLVVTGVLVYAMDHAPEGWEDPATGYHDGEKPR